MPKQRLVEFVERLNEADREDKRSDAERNQSQKERIEDVGEKTREYFYNKGFPRPNGQPKRTSSGIKPIPGWYKTTNGQ